MWQCDCAYFCRRTDGLEGTSPSCLAQAAFVWLQCDRACFYEGSIVWVKHPLGLAYAALVLWQWGCSSSLCLVALCLYLFLQENNVWKKYPLDLAQWILVVWQSDCVHVCTRIDCLGRAHPWSSTSNLFVMAMWLCLLLHKNRLSGDSIPLV